MGIYDREYYRNESRGSAWFATNPVTKWLIVVNVIVFILGHFNPESELSHALYEWFAAKSDAIFGKGYVWQLLTATFLHSDVWHILWNMLFLWVVGRELEGMYGHKDFLALYLTAAVFSTLCWAALDRTAAHPSAMIGASGAVLALVVLYTLFYPRREVLFMFIIPVEMWLLTSVYVASQVYFMMAGGPGNTAFAAHVFGALYGFLFKQFDLRWSRLILLFRNRRRPRLRIVTDEAPRDKPAARPASTRPSWASNSASVSKPAASVVTQEQLDARLDEILAKIAREGRAALTEEENRLLQEASRRARNRRSDRL